MRPLQLVLALAFIFPMIAFAQSPAIYSYEVIKLVAPGEYETRYCYLQNKQLWTDSIYVSYNWSTGDTTPFTNLGTSGASAVTVTLTVEDSLGASLTSQVVCKLSEDVPYYLDQLYCVDHAICPGPVNFGAHSVFTDSLILWSDSDTSFAAWPATEYINNVDITGPTASVLTEVSYVRVTRAGCKYTSSVTLPSSYAWVTGPGMAPSVTDLGGSYSATFCCTSAYSAGSDSYEWLDSSFAVLSTSSAFTPGSPGTFYCRYRWANFSELTTDANVDVTSPEVFCYSDLTGPFIITGVGSQLVSTPVLVFPNPVRDFFQISSTHAVQSIRVLSLDGRTVRNYLPLQQYSVDGLVTGHYMLCIQTDAGFFSQPIQVE